MRSAPATPPPLGSDPVLDKARKMAEALARASGGSVEGVFLYGSHLLGANPDKNSALDFVVVVTDYPSFYRSLRAAGELHRSVRVMTCLAAVLPPNVIAFTPSEGSEGIAKCLVVTRAHLLAALGTRPKDHFLLGRLIQKVALVWVAGDAAVTALEEAVAGARRRILSWIGPYLREPFDAEGVGRRILEVCYGGELRPEARDRSSTVFEAQREHFRSYLEPLLEDGARDGRLVQVPGGYRFAERPPSSELRRWERHFLRSKARATARWLKHVVTFDNWLPYVHRKAERRLGTTIVLTPLERRWPLVFLWPRVVRVLFSRPDREGAP